MDIEVSMWMWEKNKAEQTVKFPLVAFYPGKMQKSVKAGKYWSMFLENKSVIPIAHYMEMAYQQNNMVIYKETDLATQRLVEAQFNGKTFESKLDVYVKNRDASRVWQGSYNFDFKVEKMNANNTDDQGHKWDIALLKIIDKTERTSYPTS